MSFRSVQDTSATNPPLAVRYWSGKPPFAFVLYDQLTPTTNDSINISSVTDNAGGDSSMNYTAAAIDAADTLPFNNSRTGSGLKASITGSTLSNVLCRWISRSPGGTQGDTVYHSVVYAQEERG